MPVTTLSLTMGHTLGDYLVTSHLFLQLTSIPGCVVVKHGLRTPVVPEYCPSIQPDQQSRSHFRLLSIPVCLTFPFDPCLLPPVTFVQFFIPSVDPSKRPSNKTTGHWGG